MGVTLIPGVELSVLDATRHLHLLGYMFDHQDRNFLNSLGRLQEGRERRNSQILYKLNELGFPVDAEELALSSGHGQCGRPHIARILVQKGWVKTMDIAFREYLGQGKPAYCSRFLYRLEEAIDILHDAGGIAVLAHPLQLGVDERELESVLRRLKIVGLDGVEVYYPTHSKKFRKKLCLLAEKLGLLKSGGSDYHGSIRPGTTLAGRRNMSVPDAYLQAILQRTTHKE